MAEAFSVEINNAIRDRIVPNAAVIGIDKNGNTLISETYGNLSLSSDKPIQQDTPMWIASSTKLITAISAVQLVQSGQLSLTDPVDSILPELALDKLEIVTGFSDDGTPGFIKAKTHITLEMLLSHSSGLSYDIFNPDLKRVRESRGLPPSRGGTVLGPSPRLSVLIFEPGTSWEYSIGLDWAGVMIERVSGLSLDEYFQKNIWSRVGAKDSTLDPLNQSDVWKARLIGRVLRDEASGKVRDCTDEEGMFGLLPYAKRLGGGGGACYSTANDYIAVLKSLLVDDGVLLPKGNMDIFTKGRLTTEGKKRFVAGLLREWKEEDLGLEIGAAEKLDWDYALGGAICATEVEGLNGEGIMFWGGMLNNSWYLDRKAGTAGFYGTWVFPPGDGPTCNLATKFKQAVLAESRKKSS